MSLTDEQSAKMKGVAARAKAMILHPRSEWDVIAGEAADVRGLYTGYVLYLAAIPAICSFIGQMVFSGLWHPMRASPVAALISAILEYALSLASVYIVGMLIDFLAPYFGGTKDRMQAMKISAYFPTAWWLAGVFALIPALAPLRILGLFSLFVLWLGLPKLMRAPEDKAPIYVLCVVVIAIVADMLVSIIASMVSVSALGAGA